MATKRTTKRSAPKGAVKKTKRPAKKTAKKPAKKSKSAAAKKPAKKSATRSAKKSAAKKPAAKKAAKAQTTPAKASSAKGKGATRIARASSKTIPGGTAPPIDDVSAAKRALREAREIIGRVSDAEAEQILEEGGFERLLAAVLPEKSGADAPFEHLSEFKRRASLLARVRHRINGGAVFETEGGFVSPTRVQWFYDGLTFVEGPAPYGGVVGFYRDGVARYGIGVADASKEDSLGPVEADFVSRSEAKKSLRAASTKPEEGLARLRKMNAPDDAGAWRSLLSDHPWLLGAQYTAVDATEGTESELPRVTAKRALDGARDILLIATPETPVVGKNGRVLTSFRELWSRAERLRTFVQRQSAYLKRELGWKIRDPRFMVLAGSELDASQRGNVRNELERHHAAIRLLTFDDLRRRAEATHAFFAG